MTGAAALSPAAIGAQTQVATPPTIEACYVPASGTIYRVNTAQSPAAGAPSACLNVTHVRFTWSQQGPVGATGPAGPQGAPGTVGVGTGPVTGDLAGNLPAPSVTGLQGRPLASTAPTTGTVLTFTGAQWEPNALPPASLPKNGLGQFNFNNVNGFVSGGQPGAGSALGTSARGVVMLWHPKLAAFRAGEAAVEWDEAKIGMRSVAMNYQTTASGTNSTAFGWYNTASGQSSTAFGEGNLASGIASLVAGNMSEATGPVSTAMGFFAKANGKFSIALGTRATAGYDGSFIFGDGAARVLNVAVDQPNQFLARASGGVVFQVVPNGTVGCYLTQASGGWQCTSDRTKKTDFRPVDGEKLLGTLRAMPITTWRYREDTSHTMHLGPTAQDFRAAFALGSDSLTIGTVDAQGVALAAAHALEARTRTLSTENAELRADNADLRALLASMSTRLRALETRSLASAAARNDSHVQSSSATTRQ
jgi:hypothetical protein